MSFNSSNWFSNSLASSLICYKYRTGILIFMALAITYILFLFPLFFLILYLGFHQSRKQRCRSTTATMSHSDFFTFNVVGLELISILGTCLYCFGAYAEGLTVQVVGMSFGSITSPGQTLFHLLTCVERYLAAVHPITYLALKQAGGVRIRNISTGCVWLLCAGLGPLSILSTTFNSITNSCLMVFALILVSFCSFSVLCVLNHSGPGEVSGDRERVDQLKHRAFHTIVAIMIALLLRFVGVLVCKMMFTSSELTFTNCVVGSSAMWLALPCSLVLPLLFLQRAGKLPGCKCNVKSG